MNSTTANPSDTAPRRRSIVSHPWFPKAIALWFAALLGLCSLAVAPPLLERVVTALGIDRIVPAAAPPLGQTARLLLAMGMAGVGEIVGLVIGGWLAGKRGSAFGEPHNAAPNVRARDRHPDAPPRKILSAPDDLREDENLLPAVEPLLEIQLEPDHAAPAGAVDFGVPAFEDSPEPAPAGEAPQSVPRIEAKPVAVGVASASLDSLGIVQLSERLALALQSRRARQDAALDRDVSLGETSAPVAGFAASERLQAPPAVRPEPAEGALRAALVSLQRVSGAR